MALSRAEMNKRYNTSEKGRVATRRAQFKFMHKNDEHAYNRKKMYGNAELAVFDLVIEGKITVSEAAILLDRTVSGISGKLARIRKERGYT